MFVFVWHTSRYSLCGSTRWHSYHDYDPKLLIFHFSFINHTSRWIQMLHFWNTVFVLCQKIPACLRPGWWSVLVSCLKMKILFRTFVHLSCVVTVLQYVLYLPMCKESFTPSFPPSPRTLSWPWCLVSPWEKFCKPNLEYFYNWLL